MVLLYYAYVITRTFAAIISLVIGGVVIKKYLEYKIRVILFLLGPSISYFVLSSTSLIPNFYREPWVLTFFSALQSINSVIFFTSVLLFFNYFSGQQSILRMSVVASGITGVLVLQFASYQLSQPEIVGVIYETADGTLIPDWSGLVYIVLMPVYIMVAIWSYQDIKKSFENILSVEQLSQLKIMRWGFVLIFISGIIINPIAGFLSTISFEYFYWLTHILLIGILVPLGLILIAIAYLTTERLAFLQPAQVDGLLVIHKIGTPLFQYEFASSLKTEIGLASGAIKAITAIMEEAFGVSSDIDLIKFKNKELLLEFSREIAFILITEKSSKFLRSSLQRFKQRFVETNKSELDNYTGVINEFQDSDDIVKYAFGM